MKERVYCDHAHGWSKVCDRDRLNCAECTVVTRPQVTGASSAALFLVLVLLLYLRPLLMRDRAALTRDLRARLS